VKGMAEDWKGLFAEYPILQVSLICKDITTNLDGQRTFNHELLNVPQKGIDQFVLVHVWRGTNTAQTTFYEVVDLVDPDGGIISQTICDPFQVFGPSYRHYNYFAYTRFTFPKKGTYEFHSMLFKGNEKDTLCVHEDFLLVM
jgi:hypothetical protein